MASAFEMADAAVRHLNQDQYDRDTANLVRRLFLPKSGQDVNDKRKISKVKSIFENIIRDYRTEQTGNLDGNEVVRLFCHYSYCRT
jgi:hypothetical protein